MANRHLARGTVLQALYEWDFGGFKNDISLILERDAGEFSPGMGDRNFTSSLAKGIAQKRKDLDAIITEAAPEWPIDKINTIDRNILRIGLYELIFGDKKEVPPKVAINEAIELAKKYGGETSFKFINGVLGAVYREMGEPGKDDKGKQDLPPTLETLAGAVIYARKDKEVYLCLVHDVFGHWTLSKGHIDPNNGVEEELKKAIKEELGIEIKVEDHLGHTEYGTFDPDKGKLRKKVEYYLAESDYADVVLKKTGGLDDVKWFRLADILDLNFYDDIMPIVTKAINLLISK